MAPCSWHVMLVLGVGGTWPRVDDVKEGLEGTQQLLEGPRLLEAVEVEGTDNCSRDPRLEPLAWPVGS